jgi:hypothetical protein
MLMQAKGQMGDPIWRLENLYWIVDENGKPTKFTLRPAIRLLLEHLHWRNVILKARQLGCTTFVAVFFLDSCLFTSDLRAGIVAHKLDAAQVIYRDKILYAYDHLPEALRAKVKALKRDGGELLLSNNSGIRVDTSMRSGTLQLVHISEYGAMCAHYPDKAREVKTGTLETAHDEAIVFIESTAEGSSGDFYDICEGARKHTGQLSRHDYRLHFFPWYLSPEYRLDPSYVQFTREDGFYFASVESQTGCTINPEQRAWYVKKREKLGPDMLREYPSTPQEAFQASNFSIFDGPSLDWLQSLCRPPIATVQFAEVVDDGIQQTPRPVPVERLMSVWKIWDWPHSNHEYIVYGDVMEGLFADPDQPEKGHDLHAAGILDRNTGSVVATYHSQQDTIPYAQQLILAARHYNEAWASPEVNSVGLAVLNEFKRAQYPRIFSRQTGEETFSPEDTDKLGLKIGPMNRKPYLEALRTVIKTHGIHVYDEDVVAELRAFVNRNGKWQAERGANDDFVMMLLGLVQLHQQCPFGGHVITQTDTSDRPGQRDDHFIQASVAGAVDGFEIDDEEGLGL